MVEGLYNALLVVTSPLWGLWLLWRLIVQRKDRRAFGQRWRGLGVDALPPAARGVGASPTEKQSFSGIPSPHGPPHLMTPRIWIHAVSVGEVMAVVPLVKVLRRDHPRALLVGSTVTDLGQETMKAKLPELDAVCYLPFDLGWSVGRTIASIRPTLFLFAETELWPNLLLALHRSGVPAVMVNGRVSERSVRRYRWIGPFIRRVVRSLTALTVQREADRERFIRLGADPARVTVCGNLKADGTAASAMDAGALKRAMGLGGSGAERLIIVGSTHDPEEAVAARAFLDLSARDSGLRLCIAPRHLNRCDAIEVVLRGMELSPVRRSRLPVSGRAWTDAREVVLLDTMGELAAGYELASVVVLGGTFAPIGGHNLLEPAAAGRPVLFGPHIGQWKSVAEELAGAGGAIGVSDASELVRVLGRLLADDGGRRRMGEAARAYVHSQQGATEKVMAVITRVMEGGVAPADVADRHKTTRVSAVSRWLWQPGPLGVMLKWLLAPISWGYGLAMSVRRWAYHQGVLRTARLPVQVISVGNLTVGGSGKTPVVMAIARMIASTGRSVGVVTRGYRGDRPGDPWLVSDGRTIRATVEEAGDEAILLAARLERVPVAVGRDRAAAGRLLLAQTAPSSLPPEVVIMDDGFQHLALHRDLDLLVIDAGRPALDQRLLPCGPLRESWSAVRDASAVIVVDRLGTMTAADERRLRDGLGERGYTGPWFLARLRPSGLVALPSGELRPLAALQNTAVAICSGVGHPESFRALVVQAGARLVDEWVFDDHHHYTSDDTAVIFQTARRLGATMLVTTEKDAVKLQAPADDALPVVAVRVETVIEPDSEWRQWLMRQGIISTAVLPSGGPRRESAAYEMAHRMVV
jgi:tetraacyldisaccharide 4'-kinase